MMCNTVFQNTFKMNEKKNAESRIEYLSFSRAIFSESTSLTSESGILYEAAAFASKQNSKIKIAHLQKGIIAVSE